MARMGSYLLGACLAAMSAPLVAQVPATTRSYSIEAQDLGTALRAFAVSSGRQIIADADLIAGKRSSPVHGPLEARAAVEQMLAGTGLSVEILDGDFIVQKASTRHDAGNGADILVVGTRIRGTAPVGSPVTIIDRSALEKSGRGTIQSFIETIPSNFGGGQNEATFGTSSRNNSGENQGFGSTINLRGLGASATLVLFDGNRPALGGTSGTFADVSLVPQIAVEQIEVLTDGASAIYGTDAVAGVVNLRFRNHFEGAETWLRGGVASGFKEGQIGQIVGKSWSSGHAVLAYQYSQRGNLSAKDRPYATSDLTPFGGPNYRSSYAAPGTIIAANGAVFGIPANQDGRSLTASQLLPGVTNQRDAEREADLLPAQHSHALYGSVEQEVGSHVTLFGRALWARRDYKFYQVLFPDQLVSVPVSNAFYVDPIGTRQPVTVLYDFGADFGRQYRIGHVTGLSTSGGIRATFGPWHFEAAGNYGSSNTKWVGYNIINSARLAAELADSNPLTAYNVFGAGGSNSAAVIDAARGSQSFAARYRTWGASLRADGPLVELPTGTVRLAFGGEHRDEQAHGSVFYDVYATPFSSTLPLGLNHRNVDAVYAEALVPLSGGRWDWLPGKLNLSLAGRKEWYSDSGKTFNPKVGIAWTPIPGLTLRGSFGRSFHAPGFDQQIGTQYNLYQPYQLDDPQSPTGHAIALGLFGYGANLRPERATSWTAGTDLKDWPIKGLSIQATYFNIAYRDRIATATAEYLNFLRRRDLYAGLLIEHPPIALVESYFASPNFYNPLGVTPQQIDVIANGLVQNLATSTVRGVDFSINYRRPAGAGTVSLGLTGTRLLAIDQRVTSTAAAANVVGVLGFPVKLRLRGEAGYELGGLTLSAFVNRSSGYDNQNTNPTQHVRSWTTLDAQIGYRLGKAGPLAETSISLSATNVFNRQPPYAELHYFNSTLGYDPDQASPVGRLVSLQLTGRF